MQFTTRAGGRGQAQLICSVGQKNFGAFCIHHEGCLGDIRHCRVRYARISEASASLADPLPSCRLLQMTRARRRRDEGHHVVGRNSAARHFRRCPCMAEILTTGGSFRKHQRTRRGLQLCVADHAGEFRSKSAGCRRVRDLTIVESVLVIQARKRSASVGAGL